MQELWAYSGTHTEFVGGLKYIQYYSYTHWHNQHQGICVYTIASGCPLHAVNLCLLTSPLDNHTGVEPASMITIVCTVYVLLSRLDCNLRPHHWP